jgi:chemotaxis protein CheD
VEFVREFVREQGLQVLGEDLGGAHARRVLYFPRAGRLRVRELTAAPDSTVISRERLYLRELAGAADGKDLP